MYIDIYNIWRRRYLLLPPSPFHRICQDTIRWRNRVQRLVYNSVSIVIRLWMCESAKPKKENVTIGEHYYQLSLLPHTLILGSQCGCYTTITTDLPRGNKEQTLTISLHDKGRFGLNKYLISSSKMLPRIPVFVFIRGCTKRQLSVILLGIQTNLIYR